MPLTIGQTLNNRYRIIATLGQGGMGAVYKAWDISLGMHVAIKENLDASEEAQNQFGREARMLAGLIHPNLPRVTDYFFIKNQGQYLVMDFIEGEDLESMLNKLNQIPEDAAIPWINQICEALQYLHTQNPPIIHRDIKPANIRIRPDGRAMLVDFGIAKIYDPYLATTAGARAVTPGYSPPEQYGSGRTDVRTDVYALGATMYHLLTGEKLPESVNLLIGDGTYPSPRQLNQTISQPVEQAILRCIEVDTRKRLQNVSDLTGLLAEKQTVIVPASTEQVVPPSVPPSKKSIPKIFYFGVGGVVLIVILAILMLPGLGIFTPAEDTQTATATITETSMPETSTPTLTASPTASRTPTQTNTPILEPTYTYPVATKTNRATLIPTSPTEPILYLDDNYHCRGGPGSTYEILRDLTADETFRLFGWNGSDWFLIRLEDPSTRKQICWVRGGYLIQGEYKQLQICRWVGDGYTADPVCQ
jgi:serine/threonine-protein kinase